MRFSPAPRELPSANQDKFPAGRECCIPGKLAGFMSIPDQSYPLESAKSHNSVGRAFYRRTASRTCSDWRLAPSLASRMSSKSPRTVLRAYRS